MAAICFVLFFALPPTIWVFNVFVLGRRFHGCFLFCGAAVLGYLLVVAGAAFAAIEAEREFARHDLNGDGSIGPGENTPEAEQAVSDLVDDTGRQLAPITGVPISLLWNTIWFALLTLADRVIRWLWRKTTDSDEPTDQIDEQSSAVSLGKETGNPYQPPGRK